jgi:hypothetical protein
MKSGPSSEATEVTRVSTKVLNKSNYTHRGGICTTYISRIRLRFICNKARFYTCNGSFSKDFHKTFL